MHCDLYAIGEKIYENAEDNHHVKLHNHDQYEILLFLEGDAKYVVEENTYTLEPWDIIVIRKHEMHRLSIISNKRYRRIVLMVSPEFFKKYNCQEYEKQFLKTGKEIGHKIPAEYVRSCGLCDAFLRFKKYSENFKQPDSPVLRAILTEILYLIYRTAEFSASDVTTGPVRSTLIYLNNNFTEDIALDDLSEKFYLSKYYLCRAFHKATGLTIREYIRRKRLTKVRELKAEGKSITEAAMLSGFSDYSSFYRAYQKEYGCSPRDNVGKLFDSPYVDS